MSWYQAPEGLSRSMVDAQTMNHTSQAYVVDYKMYNMAYFKFLENKIQC